MIYVLWVLNPRNHWVADCIVSNLCVALDIQQFYEYIMGDATKIVYPDHEDT